ncbi:MAG: ROK family protein [Candidatus Omnitrophota bacterium]|nr:ROK family protein [Candidatus Omnitrophota bacterium]
MSKKFILAIDLGGTNLKCALLDLRYTIRKKTVLSTSRFHKKEELILAIASCVKQIIKRARLEKKDILGLGIGLPGPIDAGGGVVHFLPNIPGWKEVKLAAILRKKIGLPVYLDNDVNLMTIAEFSLGAAKGFKNALCLTLGTGVGGGIIIDGKFYRGANNAAGEIGHLPINEKGPRCNCGGSACLEAYIGNEKILQKARSVFGRRISLEELSLLARKKNLKAKRIWLEAAERLGIALVSAVNLLNLDAIIIGGGVANAGSILFNRVKETIRRRAMKIHARHVRVFKARLGSDAGLIGAAILVKQGVP